MLVKTEAILTSFQPVIIIGAPRSGTNMLRDALSRLPGFGTWPCDEIDLIWRHHNRQQTDDEFGPELATFKVQNYIHNEFRRLARSRRLAYVVEKTCANSLRVPFIDRIFPDARYIRIIRDGRDVIPSAVKRWTSDVDWLYTLRKLRFAPAEDLPFYAVNYLNNRLYQYFSREKRLASWGPKFRDMGKEGDLAIICALQWKRCVEKAEADLDALSSNRVFKIRYEDFVMNPLESVKQLLDFLGIDPEQIHLHDAVSEVTASPVGRWKKSGNEDLIRKILPVIERTLRQFGYLS